MADKTAIQWCDATFNPWRGCARVSEGCRFCYADALSARNPKTLGVWGPQGTRVVAAESYWRQPLKWNREAKAAGEHRKVFCASLADVFEGPETMPAKAWQQIDEYARYRLWATIWCTPNLDWLLLTKRPENITGPKHHIWAPGATANATGWVRNIAGDEEVGRFYSATWPPPNVWLGVSVEDQERADERIPHLLRTPAAVHFLSCEPLLGPLDLGLNDWSPEIEAERNWGIRWVIVGGESGPDARPMHPDWARSLREQCLAANVPFFFKQWGAFCPDADVFSPDDATGRSVSTVRHLPKSIPLTTLGGVTMARVGKKAAGRLLDGKEWSQFPEVRS